MNFVAVNLVHIRSAFNTKFCPVVQIKLSSYKRHFADDAKKKTNLYETLGIRSSATHNEIKKAYYDLTFRYHPDRNEDCEEAATKFREATEAYEILGNYLLRKKYDQGIPISDVKKTIRPTVEHKAQFQEFLDSRFFDYKADARSKEVEDLGVYEKKVVEVDDLFRPTAGVKFVITAFYVVIIYLSKYY